MKKQKSFAFLATVLALGTALAGCGQQQSSDSGSNSGSNSGSLQKLVIASVGPLSGQYSDYGSTAKAGAEYALKQRQEDFKKLGFDVQLLAQDDQADPKQGVAVAQMLISNPDVIGVVGHVTTGASITASAQYEQEKLVMVSPSSTGANLTEEGKQVVHRICARDDMQGSKAAIYAKNQLGVKSAYIVHDKQAYGQGLADEVKKQFEKDGVQVVGYEGITAGEKDYSAVINQIIAAKPEMIYFGGYYSDAGVLIKQLREKGFKGIVMGGDGYDSADLVKIAGADNANNVVFTSVVGDIGATEEGKKWISEFEQATGNKVGIFTSFGYDSMNVLLHGLEEAIKANNGQKPTREQVLEHVHKIKDFQGQFVKVGFDDKGDNEYASVYVYKYENGQKVYVGEAQ
ncbi:MULTISPECIES: branched-chain amino acid ABC transporter substrate-binding protein [Brevibacillus]|jgi:branched-chain amino acid transport system substrate-binding protein|uniref:Branched chain amino acid ABC transporter substrate-binding protein n=1 Tax=Brevibacillus aydinogluensis TaxID=927786 RepID=A0AA48M4M9_9BACL|nr:MULTISPECIES: branched-chain amino acid ABC transporter substrate-binding protein [Brevibacillus]MDT3417741.1 branched-chain amino acid transport system substrate-binding protein [Brevibacillus aydinogluensis]NNV03387.1 branched-chain amino acid ABC transporter substrate-binding protein [Brevibacillus sp. MCWH]REK64878.1 MAG: branched chain amino acid ABC transporter substrate-binding protein [Brevibacillus sp.]CAJ1001199.1 Branched chain amino acid ABC transporter substrate-binding protein 